jgi:biotin synthase
MSRSAPDITDRLLAGGAVDRAEATWLATEAPFDELLFGANRLRRRFQGDVVHLCSIINAKSGACSQNCAFCAQSAHHAAEAPVYPLVDGDQMTAAAANAAKQGADRFGIVTSGESACRNAAEFASICAAAGTIRDNGGIAACVSIGTLEPSDVERLYAAGLRRIHHNLETSARFFPEICSTHDRATRLATVRAAKAGGMDVCCGGLFGLGETWDDRVDLALELRELDVDAVPLNFLNPVPGTPLGGRPLLEPREALRIIALFRFVLPRKEIKVCGGREVVLRDLQSWMFLAGASGTMIGNYLTTAGRSAADDFRMFADLGLTRPQWAAARRLYHRSRPGTGSREL